MIRGPRLLTINKAAAFRLEAAADFYRGFVPGSGMAAAEAGTFTLAFRLDRTFEAVAVALRDDGDEVAVEYQGTTEEVLLRAQLQRILGLEVSGDAWHELGRREPVVGRLQADFLASSPRASPRRTMPPSGRSFRPGSAWSRPLG